MKERADEERGDKKKADAQKVKKRKLSGSLTFKIFMYFLLALSFLWGAAAAVVSVQLWLSGAY